MVQQHAAHVLGELATDHLTHVGWHWPDLKVAVGAVRNDQTVVRADCHTLQPVPVSLESVSSGGLQLGFSTLKDALAVIKHVSSWHVIERNDVHAGETYNASVRMQLDIALMPKPFQIDAVNNRDWNLASEWKRFTFTVTERAK